jgi:hypothetical protein
MPDFDRLLIIELAAYADPETGAIDENIVNMVAIGHDLTMAQMHVICDHPVAQQLFNKEWNYHRVSRRRVSRVFEETIREGAERLLEIVKNPETEPKEVRLIVKDLTAKFPEWANVSKKEATAAKEIIHGGNMQEWLERSLVAQGQLCSEVVDVQE